MRDIGPLHAFANNLHGGARTPKHNDTTAWTRQVAPVVNCEMSSGAPLSRASHWYVD